MGASWRTDTLDRLSAREPEALVEVGDDLISLKGNMHFSANGL